MSCKLDAGSSNLYCFTGPNVHSTSIYLGKHRPFLSKHGIHRTTGIYRIHSSVRKHEKCMTQCDDKNS